MAHYPMERREAMVRRLLSGEISIPALARETGIAQWTLYRWRDAARTNGEAVRKTKKHTEQHSPAQKLALVVEAVGFNEAELGEYCRKKGLYPEQIKAWQLQAERAMASGGVCAKELRDALASEKKHTKALARELRRKEKALAETAALLTLRKKAAAIWGEGEDA